MATERQHLSGRIDHKAYNTAVSPGTKIDSSHLKAVDLKGITAGGENTLLHLAASVGNLQFVQEFVRLNREPPNDTDPEDQPLLVNATNAERNTALHLAAQGGFYHVVEALLEQRGIVVDIRNNLDETALFKACESGNLDTAKALLGKCPSSLFKRAVGKRTCLTVAVNRGDSALVDHLLIQQDAKQLIQTDDKLDNTALCIAAERNYVDIIEKLIKFEPELCYGDDFSKETPLCVAAKLGHLEAVKELIKWRPEAVEIPTKYGMNVLHLAAQVSQVRIVEYLNKTVGLSCLVNKGIEEETLGSEEKTDPGEGDTPLHIAARKKNFNMVNSLLLIRGINKFAVNKEGLTALDIVRENTEYHESDKIIAKLSNYPSEGKPFLYSSPRVSARKHEVAIKTVDKTFDDRRNTELVVAVLLATMSFTAAFTVPGSFVTDDGGSMGGSPAPSPQGSDSNKSLGSPILLGKDSFKVFLIFDCVAFFLSLFVVLMWQMSTPITTGDKVAFLCLTNLLVCATFAFTAYGFMLAVHSMLHTDAEKLAWVVLGVCLFICCYANLTFFYMAAKFSVKKARFNQLNGLLPFLPDRVGEYVWTKLEKCGRLNVLRRWKDKWLDILCCNCHKKDMAESGEDKAHSVICL